MAGTYELDGKDAYNAVTWALEVTSCSKAKIQLDTARLTPHIFQGRLSPHRELLSSIFSIYSVLLPDSRTLPVFLRVLVNVLYLLILDSISIEWYENERECGKAILDFCHKNNMPRSSVFYTTKLKYNNGYEGVTRSIQKSVDECGLGFIDLYLIHGPIGGKDARLESWRAICEAQKSGKLKSIGISTFGIRHMQEIVDFSASAGLPLPSVHQVRSRNPLYYWSIFTRSVWDNRSIYIRSKSEAAL